MEGAAFQHRRAAYLGGYMEYTVQTALGALFAIDPRVDAPHAAGSEVAVELASTGVVPLPKA